MIAWINFFILIFASLLFTLYYIRSVSPATLEKIMRRNAYRYCERERIIAMVFEMIAIANYIVYYFYPLATPLPEHFPWPWWVSIIIAVVIGVPSTGLMLIGIKDAGEEALRPRKEHSMYGGIYAKLRHPQATGEVFLWWVIAFFLHSPFLVLLSLIYFPIFIMVSFAEEQDLLWRYGDSYVDYYKQTGAFFPKKIKRD